MESILNLIDEQMAFEFNGKINILDAKTKQYLGAAVIRAGSLIHVSFRGQEASKALFSIYIQECEQNDLSYVVEPEIVDGISSNIHFPFSTLRKKLADAYTEYKTSAALRPPSETRLLIKEGWVASNVEVTPNEYDILCIISDYNRVGDIYQNSPLLDFEITMALVSLRKKGALKVVQ